MNKQTLKTILSKLNEEEQQQIICLAEIDDLLIDFVHKDETEEFKQIKQEYKEVIEVYAKKLAETQDIYMLDNINYANNELNKISGYSNCLSDLSSELFSIYYKYNKDK